MKNFQIPVAIDVCLICLIFYLLVSHSLEPIHASDYKVERCRVDSITTKQVPTLIEPETHWINYTKYGSYTTFKKYYNVGDSIDVKLIKWQKQFPD